jgi:hypothetical protein
MRPWSASRASSDQPSASRIGQEACRRSPLAPRPVQLLQTMVENRVWWSPRVRRIPQFVGENPSTIGRYV